MEETSTERAKTAEVAPAIGMTPVATGPGLADPNAQAWKLFAMNVLDALSVCACVCMCTRARIEYMCTYVCTYIFIGIYDC